jgi:hypothetical protein
MKLLAIVVLLAVFGLALAYILPHMSRARASISPCVWNLMLIQAAKEDWAGRNNNLTNATPNWNDLKIDFYGHKINMSNGIPVCPQGGTYTIGRVGEPPTCSIGGPRHSLLPQN